MKLKIEQYCVGQVQTNCYFAVNTETDEMFIVDPGDCAEELAEKIKVAGYEPTAILLTHGHFDHAMGAEKLAQLLEVQIYAHEKEKETLENPSHNVSAMAGRKQIYYANVYVKDEQELDLAGFHIRVLYTPGHTAGGCCYYLPYEDTLFSGDTLFSQSVGRTDFPGGSMKTLVSSIQKKLMVLPEQTKVYPGHMEQTTIEIERKWNPYL